MKKIYIIFVLLAGTGLGFAQQNKTSKDKQETKENSQLQDENLSKLPSEKGLKKVITPNSKATPKGNLIPGTSDIELIKSTIPGMKPKLPHPSVSKNTVKGLPNTATLEEIKKTISQ